MIVLNADCLTEMRGLPEKSVGHTISDPPYEAATHEGMVQARRKERSRHLESVTGVELSFPPLTDALRNEYSKEIVRVTQGWAILFCQAEAVGKWKESLEAQGAHYRRACLWVKPGAMPQFSGDRPGQGYEQFVCAWCGPLPSRWNAGGKTGNYVHPIPRGEDRFHETQKPLSLMMDIVRDFTAPGDLIMDPFAGSGTTLIAAKILGRRYFGYEMNPEYAKVANERIMGVDPNNRDQLVLF